MPGARVPSLITKAVKLFNSKLRSPVGARWHPNVSHPASQSCENKPKHNSGSWQSVMVVALLYLTFMPHLNVLQSSVYGSEMLRALCVCPTTISSCSKESHLTFWSLWPPQSLVSRKVIETKNCNFPNFKTSALLWLCVSLQFISIQEWKWWRQQIDNICWIFSCHWSQNIVENACFFKTRSSPSHAVMGLIGGVKVYQSSWERDQDSSR